MLGKDILTKTKESWEGLKVTVFWDIDAKDTELQGTTKYAFTIETLHKYTLWRKLLNQLGNLERLYGCEQGWNIKQDRTFDRNTYEQRNVHFTIKCRSHQCGLLQSERQSADTGQRCRLFRKHRLSQYGVESLHQPVNAMGGCHA